jgi:hypothetical protein
MTENITNENDIINTIGAAHKTGNINGILLGRI